MIGREHEIERVIQILSRRTKNNPCLIGEPGVGKTAIAEGLAAKIVEGNIPDTVKGKRVMTLDVPAWWQAPSTGASLRKESKTC